MSITNAEINKILKDIGNYVKHKNYRTYFNIARSSEEFIFETAKVLDAHNWSVKTWNEFFDIKEKLFCEFLNTTIGKECSRRSKNKFEWRLLGDK